MDRIIKRQQLPEKDITQKRNFRNTKESVKLIDEISPFKKEERK